MHDLKPVVRQGFYEEELYAVEEFCKQNRLFVTKSSFKVVLDDKNPYTNKGLPVQEQDDRRGMYFVYISKEEQKAWLANYFELINNHEQLGLLLGYPQCCIDFFCRNFNAENTNLELPPTNPYTNLSRREDDLVVLSHFPCSSECPESIALAQRYLSVLKKVNRERAEELVLSLQRN